MAADESSPSSKPKEVPGTDTYSKFEQLLTTYLPTLGKISDVVIILDRVQNLSELPRRSGALVRNVDKFLTQVNFCHSVMTTKDPSHWNRVWTELSKNYINTFLSDEYGPLPAEILPTSLSPNKCPLGPCPTDPKQAHQTLTTLATTFREKAATHMLTERWVVDGVKLLVYFAQVAQGISVLGELKIDVEDLCTELEHCRNMYCTPVLNAMQMRFQVENTSPEDALNSFACLITKGIGHLECLQRRITQLKKKAKHTRNTGGLMFITAALEFVASGLQLKSLWNSANRNAKLVSMGKTAIQGAYAGASAYITYASHLQVEHLEDLQRAIGEMHGDLVTATQTLRKYARRTGALPQDPSQSPLPSSIQHFYGIPGVG